jgi:hypothetical protein
MIWGVNAVERQYSARLRTGCQGEIPRRPSRLPSPWPWMLKNPHYAQNPSMSAIAWLRQLSGLFIDIISTGPDDHRIVALPTMSGRSA